MRELEWTQDWGIAQNKAASTLGRYIKGYLARKQVEKIRKDNDEEAEARRQVEGSKAQVHTGGSPGSLGGDLEAECFRAQVAALAQMSRVGWDGETMTRNPNDILKAKWRARRVLLDLSHFEVADLLADVTQLPQYRQIFEQAGISGKRLLNINMNVLTQLGLRQHGHQKIYFAAIKEVQKYCDDMEHVPASQYYPDRIPNNLRFGPNSF